MYYDHADLTRNFDAGTLQRGEDVARKGKVRMARRDDDKLVGEVGGSGGELYRQTVRFRAERGGIGFQGSCSCPMSYNCKHVVALLLADLDHCQHAMARSPAPRPGGPPRLHLRRARRRKNGDISGTTPIHDVHALLRASAASGHRPGLAHRPAAAGLRLQADRARHAGRKNPGAAVAQGRTGRCGAGQRRGNRTGAGTAGGRPARDLLPGC